MPKRLNVRIADAGLLRKDADGRSNSRSDRSRSARRAACHEGERLVRWADPPLRRARRDEAGLDAHDRRHDRNRANDSRRSSFERRHALTSRGHLRPRKVDRRLRAAPKIARVSAGKADASVSGRSREQRLRALRLANEIRSARAQLKKDLASGKIELAQVLARPPECVRTARVRDVLFGAAEDRLGQGRPDPRRLRHRSHEDARQPDRAHRTDQPHPRRRPRQMIRRG
jgi:hypothetical protein